MPVTFRFLKDLVLKLEMTFVRTCLMIYVASLMYSYLKLWLSGLGNPRYWLQVKNPVQWVDGKSVQTFVYLALLMLTNKVKAPTITQAVSTWVSWLMSDTSAVLATAILIAPFVTVTIVLAIQYNVWKCVNTLYMF